MKKIIQICSVLSLIVFVSVVSAQAQQVIKRYKAEIPFDFNIGHKSHRAGNYAIKISKLALNNVVLTLEDAEKNILQTIFIRKNDIGAGNEPRLIFTRYDDRRFLSEMVVKEMNLLIGKAKNFERILKTQARPEVGTQTKPVVVVLK